MMLAAFVKGTEKMVIGCPGREVVKRNLLTDN